jgi:hypothetical protein
LVGRLDMAGLRSVKHPSSSSTRLVTWMPSANFRAQPPPGCCKGRGKRVRQHHLVPSSRMIKTAGARTWFPHATMVGGGKT